jgi:hypothetical protein
MPNISPPLAKKLYRIYDNKPYSEDDIAVNVDNLKGIILKCGLEADMGRGDSR